MGYRAAQAAAEARSQYGIDDDLDRAEPLTQQGIIAVRSCIHRDDTIVLIFQLSQRGEMLTRFVTVPFFLAQDIYVHPGAFSQKVAGNDETITAVVTLAAADEYIFATPAAYMSAGLIHDGMTGIFHQYGRCNGKRPAWLPCPLPAFALLYISVAFETSSYPYNPYRYIYDT
jgi:hypothetical protein